MQRYRTRETIAKLLKAAVMGVTLDPFYDRVLCWQTRVVAPAWRMAAAVMGNLIEYRVCGRRKILPFTDAEEVMFASEEGKALLASVQGIEGDYIGHCILGYRVLRASQAKPKKLYLPCLKKCLPHPVMSESRYFLPL